MTRAKVWGQIKGHPIGNVKLFNADNQQQRFLSEDEM
jgi:hypothetical protein